MNFLQDLRLAARTLLKRRGISMVIVLTLALGIGANATQFALHYGYLVRPLPFAAPEELVSLHESQPKLGHTWKLTSPPNLRDWQDGARSFAGLAAYAHQSVNLATDARPERISRLKMSADLFPLIGVDPILGRHLRPEDDQPGGAKVVLISHQLWQQKWAGDRHIVGKTVLLDDQVHEIVGVMPKDFGFPSFTDLWTPLALDFAQENRDDRFLWIVGRLAEGVSLDQAQNEMTAMAARLEEAHPDVNTGWSVKVRDLRDEWTPPAARVGAYAQLASVGFVLLIVCANLTNLMLALGVSRRQEVALRSALGASRGQLMRQFFAESFLLSLVGGVVGALMAVWGVEGLRAILPVKIPYWIRFEVGPEVLVYTLFITLATGLLVGLTPALRGTKGRFVEALKSGGATENSVSGKRVRSAMVIGQFALSMVLLACAMLMIKSFQSLQSVDPGFADDEVLTASLSLTGENYQDPETRLQLAERLQDRLTQAPGVLAAGVGDRFPGGWSGFYESKLDVMHQTFAPGEHPIAFSVGIDPNYFETFEIALVQGRSFTQQEAMDGAPKVVVNRTLAEQIWPGEDALGRRLSLLEDATPDTQAPWLEVIGIVDDIEPAFVFGGTDRPPEAQLYVPIGRTQRDILTIAMRGSGDAATLAPTLRRTLKGLDPNIPLHNVRSAADAMDELRWAPQFFSRTLTLFALLAVLITAIGAYGLTVFSVSRRQREMGMRIALGAKPRQLEGMVLREGQTQALIGIAVGLLLAFPLMRLLSAILYGISAADPQVFLGVVLILIGVASVANYLPARQAARTDPLRTLRSE